MSIEKIRKTGTMILACALGMVIIQLVAPLILGILVQGAALVVPLAAYHFFVKEKWRVKLVREKGEPNPFENGRNPFDEFEDSEPEMSERESEDEPFKKKEVKDSRTAAWYEQQGREKIRGIVRKLTERDIGGFWIRKDGICNIRTGKGYRRAGMIPGFSEADREILVQLLNDEGFMAEDQGKYLYLTWAV